MVATRGRTFKRPWRRSYHSSKLKSSSAPTGRKDSWCFHAVGSSNAPLLGSTAAEGLPRIGRTSIATRWRSCGLPQSASCSENFVILPDVFGQTLTTQKNATKFERYSVARGCAMAPSRVTYSGNSPTDRSAVAEAASKAVLGDASPYALWLASVCGRSLHTIQIGDIGHNAEFNTTPHVTLGPSCRPGLTSPRDESADPCPLSVAHCFDLSRSTSHFSVRSDLSRHSCRPFLQDAGSGPRKSGSCWVRQLRCDLYVVPWPGVWRIVSGPFEQNLLFVPFRPQAPPSCIWQPMGFGR